MDLFAPVSRRLIAPLWAAWEKSRYLKDYRELVRTQFDPLEIIQATQLRKIEQLVTHAHETSAFWHKRFSDIGLSPGDICSFEDYRNIPLLTKADLRSEGTRLRSKNYHQQSVRSKKTSGSTGVSVEVFVDETAVQYQRASTLRADEWSGWRLGERSACVWGNPEYVKYGWRGRLRNALLHRQAYLDTVKMDASSMKNFLDLLRRRSPSLLFGHAHSLYLFAMFCQTLGGAGFRPKGIISTAMVLHDFERQVIEDVFGCRVTNRYGCEEVSLIACQCEQHAGLHVNAECIFLEILHPDGSPCLPGETGAVVVTDLVNRAMPMIRYQVGDMAAWSTRPCECGRGLPVIERIEGRIADYVVTPGGEFISGISLTENFAVLVKGIAQLQIIQESLDRFTFRIVRGDDYDHTSEQMIRKMVVERFGSGVHFECQFVDRIDPEPSGKYRFCISKVKKPFDSPK